MKVWWKLYPWTEHLTKIDLSVLVFLVRHGYADTDGQLRLFV